MFFVINFVKDVTVSPSDLSKDLTKIIKVKLFEQVTGTCHPKYGYFIKIISVGKIENGLIMEGSGDIVFKIKYQVALMRPFKGEVCDGIINSVMAEGGIHVQVGPMKVYIAEEDLQDGYTLDKKSLSYISDRNKPELKVGAKIRFRYKEIQLNKNNNEFCPIGTIKGKYLGSLED